MDQEDQIPPQAAEELDQQMDDNPASELLPAPEGDYTIYEVASLKDSLFALVEDREDTRLDLSQVTAMDSAGLQLLVALRQRQLGAGQSLAFCNASDPVRKAFSIFHLDQSFLV
jgi:anti-anti-sigma factor